MATIMNKHQTAQTYTPLSFPRPLSTVDVAIFSIRDERLHILLAQREGKSGNPFPNAWGLVGGFIDVEKDESLEDCALRKLREKTKVTSPYLEQLGCWGGKKRDPRGWSITHAYFALIPPEFTIEPMSGPHVADAKWVPILKEGVKEKLAFDHDQILSAAISRLRSKVEYTSLPAFLLDREFTMSELQRVYEIVLGRKLEKSSFRTRILATNLVTPLPRYREGANRPAQLYKLRSQSEPIFFQRTFKPGE
jgi:ADP-ribose pyrophosphatase YjhB (NUDIX family)